MVLGPPAKKMPEAIHDAANTAVVARREPLRLPMVKAEPVPKTVLMNGPPPPWRIQALREQQNQRRAAHAAVEDRGRTSPRRYGAMEGRRELVRTVARPMASPSRRRTTFLSFLRRIHQWEAADDEERDRNLNSD